MMTSHSMAMWTCYLCSFKTLDIAKLKNHVNNLHSSNQGPDKKRPHTSVDKIQDLSKCRRFSSTSPDVIVLKNNSFTVAPVNKTICPNVKIKTDSKEESDVEVIEIKKWATKPAAASTPIVKYFGLTNLPFRCKFCIFGTNSLVGMKRHENRQHPQQCRKKIDDLTGSGAEPEMPNVSDESDTKRSKLELPGIQTSKVPFQITLVKGQDKSSPLDNHKDTNLKSGTATKSVKRSDSELTDRKGDNEHNDRTLAASHISIDCEMNQKIRSQTSKPLKLRQELNESFAFVRIDGVRCQSCPHIASSHVLLQVHVDREHGGGVLSSGSIRKSLRERNINKILINEKAKYQPREEEKKRKHFCLHCKENFATDRCLQMHNKSKHEVVNRSNIRRRYHVVKTVKHLKYFGHHNGNCIKYQCSICRKMLVSKNSLQKHTKSVHEKMRRKNSKQFITSAQDQAKPDYNWADQMDKCDFLMLFSLKRS